MASLKKILCGFDNQNDVDATQFTVSEVGQSSAAWSGKKDIASLLHSIFELTVNKEILYVP